MARKAKLPAQSGIQSRTQQISAYVSCFPTLGALMGQKLICRFRFFNRLTLVCHLVQTQQTSAGLSFPARSGCAEAKGVFHG